MREPLSVIIAPDSFKGSTTAGDAAAAIARGWSHVRPFDALTLLPQADGGEGTLEAIERSVPGAIRHRAGPVTGPHGQPTPGEWVEVPPKAAIVELAQCSGITLMDCLDPLRATTRGVGEVIRAALSAGMRSITVALGGSASTDGGAGALSALGLRLLDSDGRILGDGGARLVHLHRCETTVIPPPPDGVTLLVDVTAPLLGPRGAAAAFAPQKGARPTDVVLLEKALATFARHLGGDPDAPGAGAAGGTGYGFAAAWGAKIESGARWLQRLTGLDAAMKSADIAMTGEGRFDATSTAGKVVGELLSLADRHGVRAGVIAGSFAAETDRWSCSLQELAQSERSALANPLRYLELAGRDAAQHFGA